MFANDIIMRQIQQLLAALLKRAAETMQIPTIGELENVLEEVSGLQMSEMETTDVKTLAYLLKLRCGHELRAPLAEALRLLSEAKGEQRWKELAATIEFSES